MKHRIFTGVFAGLGLLLLILDARTALDGAAEAIRLCIRVVIPSMFPFFILSILLTNAISGSRARALAPIGKLLKMPKGTEAIFLTGLLGGYPSGAQAVAQAWRCGQLDRNEAKRMLGFCSNAGPAFLFGVLSAKFPSIGMLWLLWGIHIFSAAAASRILPGGEESRRAIAPAPPVSLSRAMEQSIKIMANVCGWILVFRVILSFFSRWFLWLLPEAAQVGICGALEIANGCAALSSVENIGLRFILCSGILGFGGICVAMQTASVTAGLGLGWYLPGKCLQGVISLLLSALLQLALFPAEQQYLFSPLFPAILVTALAISLVFLQKKEKRSGVPEAIGV